MSTGNCANFAASLDLVQFFCFNSFSGTNIVSQLKFNASLRVPRAHYLLFHGSRWSCYLFYSAFSPSTVHYSLLFSPSYISFPLTPPKVVGKYHLYFIIYRTDLKQNAETLQPVAQTNQWRYGNNFNSVTEPSYLSSGGGATKHFVVPYLFLTL